MAKILDGIAVSEQIARVLSERVSVLGFSPKLVIISVGEESATESYIKAKIDFAKRIGVVIHRERLPADVTEANLYALIDSLNKDIAIHGIIVQLPLPTNFSPQKVLDLVISGKDVDSLSSKNLNAFYAGERGALLPATARGVMSLLSFYGIQVEGRKAVVIGRSEYVGKPIAEALRKQGAIVEVVHRGSENFSGMTRSADILVTAAGRPSLIGENEVVPGQTVIDVGITSMPPISSAQGAKRRIKGDVCFSEVEKIVDAITPVPGGVGPLTVASLFQNLLDLTERAANPGNEITV